MIIKISLITLFFGLFIIFIGRHKTNGMKATKKLVIVLFFIIAVLSVIFPEITNDAARLVGVGRGADLLLYLTVAVFVTYVLNQYSRSKEQEQRLVKLARKLAIIEAKNDSQNLKIENLKK